MLVIIKLWFIYVAASAVAAQAAAQHNFRCADCSPPFLFAFLAAVPAADIGGFNKAYELSNYALAGMRDLQYAFHQDACQQDGPGCILLASALPSQNCCPALASDSMTCV
jgi:hypothetical protein